MVRPYIRLRIERRDPAVVKEYEIKIRIIDLGKKMDIAHAVPAYYKRFFLEGKIGDKLNAHIYDLYEPKLDAIYDGKKHPPASVPYVKRVKRGRRAEIAYRPVTFKIAELIEGLP